MSIMLAWLAALVPLGVALGWLYHRAASAIERRRYPPTGELVEVGRGLMHLRAMGMGEPTVVLDSALAGTSLSWSEIQPKIAAFARVVSYDRVGFGWSDANGKPRTIENMLSELRELLARERLEPPYVLVGHSYGGWIAELFASRHRGELAGMVLVDTPHPSEWATPDEHRRKRVERGARLARRGSFFAWVGGMRLVLRLAGGRSSNENNRVRDLLSKTPEAIRAPLRSFWVQSKTLRALASQIEHAPESAKTVLSERSDLGDVPLVVITAAAPAPRRLEEQLETTALSRSGRHVMAMSSGHWIPLEEPQLVVDAVRHIVDGTT